MRAAMRGTYSNPPPVKFLDDKFRNCHLGAGRAAMQCIAWAKAERIEARAVGKCPSAAERAAAATDSSAPTAFRLQP